MRADSLATKCVSQYRSRDIFAYLAIRYCLESDIARKDAWVEQNAVQVVLGSPKGSYIRSYHFKQIDDNGAIENRELFVPGVTEALAEASLLAACASHAKSYSLKSVFSYRPTGREDRSAYFEQYMVGLRQRQHGIAEACAANPDGVVVYTDIERFYPSISFELAKHHWLRFCKAAELDIRYNDLGLKLIENYKQRADGDGLLTGPMFCHFLANLVLCEIDAFAQTLPVHYFRYVDDMTLVGSEQDVHHSVSAIAEKLAEIGLKTHPMHSSKTLVVPVGQWLRSTEDFLSGHHAVAWMRLIGDIKKTLLFDSEKSAAIEDAMTAEGFRLPIPDYVIAITELTAFQKVRRLGLWNWLRFKTRKVTIETIVIDARTLSDRLFHETRAILTSPRVTDKYEQKRVVSKLRYRLGRLIYIGNEKQLTALRSLLASWRELTFYSAIIDALLTEDCSRVVAMGANVSQATAQVFRPALKTARFSKPVVGETEVQGLAVFILNGVPVEAEVASPNHPLLRFARGPVDAELMKSPRGLLQELACLHGLGETRHAEVLRSAFDVDENIILDALEMDYGYYL